MILSGNGDEVYNGTISEIRTLTTSPSSQNKIFGFLSECSIILVLGITDIMVEKLKFRLACRRDAKELARLHHVSAQKQPGAFMHLLGQGFLEAYYEILIDNGLSTILCAYKNHKQLIGFAAGSIESDKRVAVLRHYRLKLFIKTLPKIVLNPSLIREINLRKKNEDVGDNNRFTVTVGAHMEYWAWDAEGGSGAIILFKKWLKLIKNMNISEVRGEVDQVNEEILKIHLMLGAKVVDSFMTPDGRVRKVILYNLV